MVEFPDDLKGQMRETMADKATEIHDAPDPALVQARMAELRLMGFHDVPWESGVRSSMRVFAEATIISEQSKDEQNEESKFCTLNVALLERADELAKRFNIRPVGPETIRDALKDPKSKISITSKTLRETATKMVEHLADMMGLEMTPEMKENGIQAAIKDLRKQMNITEAI